MTCAIIPVGEMALTCQYNRSASILAESDCIFLAPNIDDFMTFIEDKAGLGVKVLPDLAESLIAGPKQSSKDVIRLTTAFFIALRQ